MTIAVFICLALALVSVKSRAILREQSTDIALGDNKLHSNNAHEQEDHHSSSRSVYSMLSIYGSTEQLTHERMALYYQSKRQCTQKGMSDEYGADYGEVPLQSSSLYLSIVITTNNQDVVDQHFRLSHFLKNVAAYTKKYNLKEVVEIIMVDYNSHVHLPPLWNTSTLAIPPVDGMPLLRFLVVLPRVHKQITQKVRAYEDPGYWEFVAKNIGMRRACGDYILAVNADVWLSEGFWQMVAARGFQPTNYYRMGRIETTAKLPRVSLVNWTVEEVFDHLLGSSGVVFGADPRKVDQNTPDRFNLPEWEGIREWSQTPFDVKKTTVHGKRVALGCAGDFVLMHSEALFTARGYPEVPLHQVLDDVLVMYAVNMGLQLAIPPAPALMFHMSHKHSYSGKPRPTFAHSKKIFEKVFGISWRDAMYNAASNKLNIVNDAGWGMGLHDIPEYYI